MGCIRKIERADFVGADKFRHAADVVGMGMGGHNRIQPRDAEPIQKAFDSCCIYRFSCINKHGLSTGGAQ